MTSQHSLRTELPLLALLALLWGSSYLFLKVAVTEIPPVTLIALRVTGAAGFLLVVMRIRSETLPRDWHTRRMLLQQAFFNSIGAWTVLAWGQQFVDAGLASVLNSTSPIFVFLLTALVTRHEPLGGRKLAGVFIGFFGVVLIVGVSHAEGLRIPGRWTTGLSDRRGTLCLCRHLRHAFQPPIRGGDRCGHDDLGDRGARPPRHCSRAALDAESFGESDWCHSHALRVLHGCRPADLLPAGSDHRFDGRGQPELPARGRWRCSRTAVARRND